MLKTRIVSLLTVVIVVGLLLSSCGAPVPTASLQPQPTAAVQPTAESHEPVTLTFWTAGPNPPLSTGMNDLVSQFMKKYPWITVKVESFAQAQYGQKVDMATAGGTAPDVLWVEIAAHAIYVKNGVLMPLDSFFPPNYLEDWFEASRKDCQEGGKTWSLPLHEASEAILYNEEIIKAAGLEPPKSYEKAWTFEQFADALKKVTKKGADGKVQVWGYATHYAPSCYSVEPLMYAYNGAVLTDPAMKVYEGYTNSKAAVEAFQWFCGLYKDGLAPIDRMPDLFQTGKVAFYQANPIVLADIVQRYPDLKVGVMPLPCGGQCAAQTQGFHIGIHAQTKHPQEAWLLLDFLTNPEGHKQWVEKSGYLPDRYSVYQAMPQMQEYPMNIFMEGIMKHPIRRPTNLAWRVYDAEFTKAIQNTINGADAKAELDRVAQMAGEELKRYEK